MKYNILDNWNSRIIKSFSKKSECENWLFEGLFSTEGAESDHWKYMLSQFRSGKKTICYWEK